MLGQHFEAVTLYLGALAVEVDVFDHLLAAGSLEATVSPQAAKQTRHHEGVPDDGTLKYRNI